MAAERVEERVADRVRISIEGGIAEVMLSRPDKLNAMDLPMFDAIAEAGQRLKARNDLRAVILAGEGRGFCAGIDLAALQGLIADPKAMFAQITTPLEGSASNRFQIPCTIWGELEVPVIAALHGPVFGAGMQLALGADYRIAAPSAQLSIMETRWGIIPDMGLTKLLPKLMPADTALELMLSARIVEGEEAVALGLASRLADEPLTEARAMAQRIAGRNPGAVSAIKALVKAAWPDSDAALGLEARLQAGLLGRPNQIEAVMAEREGRAPKFR